MNKEIKEILKGLKEHRFLGDSEDLILLNYITYLQEENKELLVALNKNMIERNNYLSRIEKAIEYIKENDCPDPYCLTDELLNILQGEDNGFKS